MTRPRPFWIPSVRLGSMFSDMVMGPQGEVAVLTYSDRVDLALDFTTNGDKLDTVLRGLQGRGGGMHLDDAIDTRSFHAQQSARNRIARWPLSFPTDSTSAAR